MPINLSGIRQSRKMFNRDKKILYNIYLFFSRRKLWKHVQVVVDLENVSGVAHVGVVKIVMVQVVRCVVELVDVMNLQHPVIGVVELEKSLKYNF